MKQLTFEEFAWRCLWLECGRLSEFSPEAYVIQKVHQLKRRAKQNELWQGPWFEHSEWAGMIHNWYVNYLETGEL